MAIVIKPERAADFYVLWSTIAESPLGWGTREQVARWLKQDRARRGGQDHTPEARLARADRYGTSDMSVREGEWDDQGLIYEQRGRLPRGRLTEACRLLAADDEAGVWDLLKPLDDATPVRRG